MKRRTVKLEHLQPIVDRINELQGLDPAQGSIDWSKEPKGYKTKLGWYYLQGAYGGYQLQRICNDSGGVVVIIPGFLPKRELQEKLHAYLSGIIDGRISRQG